MSARVRDWAESGRTEEVGGYPIHVFSADRDSGPLICVLHGFPSSSFDWRHTFDRLPGRLEASVLAMDFIGFGLSGKPRQENSLLVQADVVEALVARHGTEGRPVYLVGHDMGTSVGLELLARDIEGVLGFEVAGVLLFNGSMVQSAASPVLGQRLLRGRFGPLLSRLQNERFFRNQFGSVFSTDHPLTDDEATDQWQLLNYDGGGRLGHLLISYMDERERRAERWHGAIRDWKGDLRLAWGLEDPVATTNVLDAVLALRPDTPVTRLPGLGHYPQIEDPERFCEVLVEAVDSSL
jgi:pimeloyl-ACP methyl ester carboxylesterase